MPLNLLTNIHRANKVLEIKNQLIELLKEKKTKEGALQAKKDQSVERITKQEDMLRHKIGRKTIFGHPVDVDTVSVASSVSKSATPVQHLTRN